MPPASSPGCMKGTPLARKRSRMQHKSEAGTRLSASTWGVPLVAALVAAAFVISLCIIAISSAASSPNRDRYTWQLPEGFPLPYVPSENPMSAAKVALGRYLFYDTRLSGNGVQSCASCHQQALAFTDGLPRAIGSTGQVHPRNAMTLTNAAYNPTYNWANPTLHSIEQQILLPMFGEHPVEMGISGNEALVLERLRADAEYRRLFRDAFPAQPDPFTFASIEQALASFTRTLISGSSPYDAYLRGDEEAVSPAAKRGMNLFFSEPLGCQNCHMGFNLTIAAATAEWRFSAYFFANIGLYNLDASGAYPADNQGAYAFTGDAEDMGAFRPPTLRNIALTAPYMHDGSVATLRDVLDIYAQGGRNLTSGVYAGDGRASPRRSLLIRPFTLTDAQIDDLLAFLESLTDDSFIHNPAFASPFIEG